MSNISVIDQPYQTPRDANNQSVSRRALSKSKNPDKLGTGEHAESLAKFIMECGTPLTIGVQGEWGSGKTSLLNMIREDIECIDVAGTYNKVNKGKELFEIIWINTWEHSLLKSPEGCLISIIEEIINHISQVDGSWSNAQMAKNALMSLAKGAVRVGAGMTMGLKGAEVAEELVGASSPNNTVKELRRSLQETVTTVIDRKENSIKRFVVFVDDLDRLDPAVAVQVLELLKNIFTIEHCVFVLAIDYQVVVKGLKGKFGEPSEKNEWEFRAFFDKIIQLPFMMPMAKYNLTDYINSLIIEDIGYIEANAKKRIDDGRLARAVQLSLGQNPRSMKRLLNSLSLIKIQNKDYFEKNDSDTTLRQLVFALVCFQISFPRVYELMLRNPDFTSWDEQFVNRVTGGAQEGGAEVEQALGKAQAVNEEDFDEDWEKALFKIVWLKNWQRKRLTETSRLLSLIKDKILSAKDDEQVEKMLKKALEMTAVTAVSSTEEGIFSADDGVDEDNINRRLDFWDQFRKVMKGSATPFDTDVEEVNFKTNYSSAVLGRKSRTNENILYDVSTSASGFLKIYAVTGDADEDHHLIELLKNYKPKIDEAAGKDASVVFKKMRGGTNKQVMIIQPPCVAGRKSLIDANNEDIRNQCFDWLKKALPKIDDVIHSLSQELDSSDQSRVGSIEE